MSYGEIKIDTITFTAGGVDTSIAVSGLVQNPTFTGNITTTGTISGDIIRGNTISGVTVTGGTGEFAGAITASGFIPNGTGVLTNGLYSPETNRVALSTNSANRFTVTESGVFLFATGVVATGVTDKGGTVQITPKTQLAGQGSNRDTVFSLLHYSSAGFHPKIILGSSNSDTFGEYTDTVSGRVYGAILFETANANNDRFGEAAAIQAVADYTPASGLNGVPGALSFQTGPAGVVSPSERIRIASSGNVGIGSFTSGPSPSALLELRGSAAVVGTPEIFISNFGNVASGNTSSTITFRGGSLGSETSIARFTVLADGNDENGGHLVFETTASGGSLTEQMRITGSGLVGIGTTPDVRLHVADTASGSGTYVAEFENLGTGANTEARLLLRTQAGSDNTDCYIGSLGSSANNSNLTFATEASGTLSEKVRIDSSGRLLVGTPTARDNYFNQVSGRGPAIQVEGVNDANKCGIGIVRNSADDNGPELNFGKARGTSLNSNTIVSNADSLGRISFQGADGSELVAAAYIEANVDGTPGANDMPGRLVFSTTDDGASSPTERMRIDSQGKLFTNRTVSNTTGDHPAVQINTISTGTAASDFATGIDFQTEGTVRNRLAVTTNNNWIFYRDSGSNEALRIDSSGNVGIGTNAPSDYGKFVALYQADRFTAIDAFGRINARYDDNSSDIFPVSIRNQGMTTIGHGCGYRFFLSRSSTTAYEGGALMSISEDNYTSAGTANSSLYFQTASSNSRATRFIIFSNGDIKFRWSGNSYEAVIFSHTATYGSGTMQIQPESTPGSGTAQFYTHFADKVSGGTTKHNVVIGGSLSKGSGSFRIPHPLKPETHELVHSFIEGPQADLIYRGHIQLVNGAATVNIDEAGRMTEGTFEALCTNVCCFTSNESDWTAVRGSVSGNILTIEAQDPTSTAEVCWMVVGERKDPHMIETDWTDENGRVITEPLKQNFSAPETEPASA